jgi:hypothetical protein
MKLFFLATAVCSLFTGSLLAQSSQTDAPLLAKQQGELKQALVDADKKLNDRQKLYLDEHNI